MAKDKDHSSKVHPSLERAPGKSDNWLEKAGGLPPYIERIAKHLHSDKGMTISHAIATAVNTVKRWCQGGTVSKTSGPEKSEGVTPQTKAKACAAVAQWNAKKAKAGVNAGMDRDAYSDEDFVLELSQEIEDSMAWSLHLSAGEDADIEEIIEEDPETYELTEEEANEFDMDAYEQHLAQKRQGDGLDLAIFKWDPAKHPRNLLGQFREVLKTMDNGDAMELPDGTTIQKNGVGKYRRFNVHGGKSGEIKQNLRLEQVEEEVDLVDMDADDPPIPPGFERVDPLDEAEGFQPGFNNPEMWIPVGEQAYLMPKNLDDYPDVPQSTIRELLDEQMIPPIAEGVVVGHAESGDTHFVQLESGAIVRATNEDMVNEDWPGIEGPDPEDYEEDDPDLERLYQAYQDMVESNIAQTHAQADRDVEKYAPDDPDESNQEADQEIWDIVEQANPDPDRYDMEGSGDPFRYEVYDNETDNEFSLEATEDAVLDIGGYPYDWIMSVGSEDGETAQEITAGGGPEGIRRLVENFWKYVEANADWSGG